MWHCPHCGAPQAETARCWVCRRSSTTCSTCRHFRVSLAAEVGYCALDRHRRPLTGLELRACWEEGAPSAEDARGATGTGKGLEADRRSARRTPAPYRTGDPDLAPARGFVPIEDVGRGPAADALATSDAPATSEPAVPSGSAPSILPGSSAPTFLLGDPVEAWEGRTSLFGEPER